MTATPDATVAGAVTRTAPGERAELVITGMTCGACATRIERRLNRLDGVVATVSYATSRAYFTGLGGRDLAELVTVIGSAGYQAAPPAPPGDDPGRDPEARALGRRLAACAPLAVLVTVLAMVPAAQFTGWQWVSLALAAPVAAWGAWPLHRVAVKGLGQGAATMDTLVSLAVIAATGWSLYALAFGGAGALGMRMPFALTFTVASGQTLYFEAAAGVTTAVLAGRYLEARARRHSGSALAGLAALAARSVAVLRDGAEHRVPAGELAAGELIVVRPGEKIAADGVVTEGTSAVDASLVTGEPVPAEVGPGDPVTGGTVAMSGRIVVRAARVGDDTLLAQVVRLVSHAQGTKASAQRLADRIAAAIAGCVIALAVVTLGFWLGAGLPGAAAWSAAVAVLVVACPCALGLATPAALAAAVGRAAELGLLVKSARELEAGRRVRVVALDKTGTLTAGAMTVTGVITAEGTTESEALLLAGAVEDAAEHPIGQAIARAATARQPDLPPVTAFTARPGAGVRGTAAGRDITIGSPAFLTQSGLRIPAQLARAFASATGAPAGPALLAPAASAPGAAVGAAGADPEARRSAGPRALPAADCRRLDANVKLTDGSSGRPPDNSKKSVDDRAAGARTADRSLAVPDDLPGTSARASFGGAAAAANSPGLQDQDDSRLPAGPPDNPASGPGGGNVAVMAGWDGQARAVIVLADPVRPGAAEAVARMGRMGLRPVMITGDGAGTAHAVARQVGIPPGDVYAGVGPEGKAAAIRQLQAGGLAVAFAGDGVNDAAALASADLGLACGAPADVAASAAGVTVLGGDPAAIADALQLARATMRVIRANLIWAFGYNLAAIPVAALGYLNPMFAGIAMSASSLIVVATSLRLRRWHPARGRGHAGGPQ